MDDYLSDAARQIQEHKEAGRLEEAERLLADMTRYINRYIYGLITIEDIGKK